MQSLVKFINRVVPFFLLVLLLACGQETAKDGKTPEEIQLLAEEQQKFEESVKQAKKVFYSLPSPLETAIMFRHAGASFNKDILNPLDNMTNYTTNKQKALNLGIYSADLSYASLFEQTQISIKYMAAAKKMAEGLGIIDAIDKEMIEKLEENVNNKAVVMDIISQAFVNSNFSLKENDRAAIATIMLLGGWVEGLYIASQLAKMTENNNDLIDRIVDQRLPMKSIIVLLESYENNADIQILKKDIEELKDIFEKIKVVTSRIVTVTDSVTNVTTLKSSSEKELSPQIFDELCVKIASIRNNYIK